MQNVRTDEEKAFTVDGRMYGCCTNIFPIYADPEDPQTWAKYNLPDASLVRHSKYLDFLGFFPVDFVGYVLKDCDSA